MIPERRKAAVEPTKQAEPVIETKPVEAAPKRVIYQIIGPGPVRYNGVDYRTGEPIDLSEKEAARLFRIGGCIREI